MTSGLLTGKFMWMRTFCGIMAAKSEHIGSMTSGTRLPSLLEYCPAGLKK